MLKMGEKKNMEEKKKERLKVSPHSFAALQRF